MKPENATEKALAREANRQLVANIVNAARRAVGQRPLAFAAIPLSLRRQVARAMTKSGGAVVPAADLEDLS